VRDVHAALSPARPVGYTTVLKLMQIMAEKGLLERDERERAHVYRPNVGRAAAQRRAVDDLAHTLFGGSAAQLALHALNGVRATPEELDEIRRLLKSHERGAR
jgi:predicted transcriptional regulator